MSTARLLFDALRSFNRAATRCELEHESGLDYDQVHKALKTLKRHCLLAPSDGSARQRQLYQLREGAALPQNLQLHSREFLQSLKSLRLQRGGAISPNIRHLAKVR